MLFKLVSLVVAAASFVCGYAVNLEARQNQLATCVITTTPSNPPNSTELLTDEFIIVFNREYFNDIPPGSSVITGSTTFQGPEDGFYYVIKTTGASTLTPAQTRDIVRGWASETFAGGGRVGVTSWFVERVGCP